MDSRRLPHAVIDPKVRRVGFFTSGDPPAPLSQSTPADAASHDTPSNSAAAAPSAGIPSSPPASDLPFSRNSISPVMIPPLRHATAAPVPIPRYISSRRRDRILTAFGSYNASESLRETSPVLSLSSSRIDGSDYSEVASSAWLGRAGSGKAGSSFPGRSEEMMMAMNAPAMSALITTSVMKTLSEVAGRDDDTHTDLKNDDAGTVRRQKPKTTRAERRAIQEVQRATEAAATVAGKVGKPKAAAGGGAPSISNKEKGVQQPQKKGVLQDFVAASEKRIVRHPDNDRKKHIPQPVMQFDDKNRVEKAKRRAIVNQLESRNRVELFLHLPQYEHGSQLPYLESRFFCLDHIHPSVCKVGLQYMSGATFGGNARCKEMLLAFCEAIKDYSTPPDKTLIRDLTSKINSYVSFLIECRPLSVSMGNAIRFLKNRVAKLNHNLSESEAKFCLISDIERFINEKIIVADKVIVQHAVTKIRNGDVLLIYGSSAVVEMILLHAHEIGKCFRVVVVDSWPKLEGKTLLRKLVMKGLSCTYTHMNAISHVMHEVTRVFLGASSVLSNGMVYSRVGTACIAMVAHAFGVPVLICCEAYKFHERVQLDSVCCNELGNPNAVSKVPGRKDMIHLENWADQNNLQVLNLTYDATPSDYVSMIVTEHGMIPPTSVPVIVREYGRDQFLF